MECRINEVTMHYVEHGRGVPVVALHGAGVDHCEIAAAIEAIVPGTGYRRICPDLPGMGRSATESLTSNNDVRRCSATSLSVWSRDRCSCSGILTALISLVA